MTTLLERAFAEAAKLPEAEQEVLASRLLAEPRRGRRLRPRDRGLGRQARVTGGRGAHRAPRRTDRGTGSGSAMNSRTTRPFRELLSTLPGHIRRQAREAYQLFRQDPSHPGLHFKQVIANPPTYSARVGISYRAVGVRDGDTIVWFWIGSHADYDRLLDQL